MRSTKKNLNKLREKIDSLDDKLMRILAKRMQVVDKIGKYKADLGLKPLDKKRWIEVLKSRVSQGKKLNLSEKFIVKVFEIIHQESLRIEKK